MSLWDLLMGLCFAMPIAGGYASAKFVRAGFLGYLVVVTMGLALGFGCAYLMRQAGQIVGNPRQGDSVPPSEWQFRALYFAAMAWIVLSLFIGAWISSALLRICTFCAYGLSFSSLHSLAV